MEIQEGFMRLMVHRPVQSKRFFQNETEAEAEKEKGAEKQQQNKWRAPFYKSSSSVSAKPKKNKQQQQQRNRRKKPENPPKEFLCPISGSLMADPVIVSSGHTFERACVEACKAFDFGPTLPDRSVPDFSVSIPNLALKSTILDWCHKFSVEPPRPTDSAAARELVRALMASQGRNVSSQNGGEDRNVIVVSERELIEGLKENPSANLNHAATDVNRRTSHFRSESAESSLSNPPLQLATRPSCYSPPSSPEIEAPNPNSIPDFSEEEELVAKMRSPQVFEIEEAVISLRKLTRTKEESRASFCTPRLLLALRSLVTSKYSTVQVNAVAALVNLSLEKKNKVKIVRSGLVPPLIDVLKGGLPEAQEHAAGALFSLALDDDNKTAIGVLGALPPLLHLLRSESERTRHDSALALYHVSLVQSNRSKLVRLGAVAVLLGMARSGHMRSRVLLVLCNLASSAEGRAAMFDAGAVDCLVGMLKSGEADSDATRENCVAVLYGLSHGGLRFRALAKAAGLVEVLWKVEKTGSQRAVEKAARMLELMRGKDEEEDDVDWEELLDSGLGRTRGRVGMGESCANSSEF